MSIIKFIWFAVLVLIVFQFVGALNNDGTIPDSFVANILIFIVLSIIIFTGWLLGKLSKKVKNKLSKANASKSIIKPQNDIQKVPRVASEPDDPLLSMLEKGDIYGDGVDADEIPGASGEFGFEPSNPIPVKSVLGAKEYLDSLTWPDGTKVTHIRVGSTSSPHVKHPIDIYELTHEHGERTCTLHISPYHKRNSTRKPNFEKLNNQLINQSEAEITDPFNPKPELQSVEGMHQYLAKLSKLSEAALCTELSNVMTAKHNQMVLPTSINEYADKQALVSDLTDKAMWICVKVFGQDSISKLFGKNLAVLNQLINECDEQVAQLDLEPEQHGAALLNKLSVKFTAR